MIEVLSAYRFLRRMGDGQFLFMWKIATKLHVSEFPENMYLGVLFVKIRTSVLNLFLVDSGRMCYLIAVPYAGSGYAKEYGWPSHSLFLERAENACSPRL